MNKIYRMSLLAGVLFSVVGVFAQDEVPYILMSSDCYELSCYPYSFPVAIKANCEYTAQSSEEWASVRQEEGRMTISVDANYDPIEREAVVTLTSADGSIVKTIELTQGAEEFSDDVDGLSDFSIFADSLCTTLNDGVTQADIDTVSNPFVRNLAQQIYDGTYDFSYRLGEQDCLYDVYELKTLRLTGYRYDIAQGVTGIMVPKGTNLVIAVQGIPSKTSGTTRQALIYAWKVNEGEYPDSETHTLKNGINVISYDGDYDGLLYIKWFTDYEPSDYPAIKYHVINGVQNGYIDHNMTNDSCEAILEAAKYPTIDCLGSYVHAIWEADALLEYTSGEYRKYMNLLDSIVACQQYVVGITKYGLEKTPRNLSLIYVNYRYFMYCGNPGVSVYYDQQYKVCDVDGLMNESDNGIWGIAHEWGHQHQLRPYFNWSGMTEVTGNMCTQYTLAYLGTPNEQTTEWFEEWLSDIYTGDSKANTRSSDRYLAYQNRSEYSWNEKMYALFESMEDSVIPSYTEDPDRGVSFPECYSENCTGFYAIYEWCRQYAGIEDFCPDYYQELRLTESRDDKYALLAAAQNGESDRWEIFKETYPSSCWVTDNYLKDGDCDYTDNSVPFIFNYIMVISKLSGYNLYPYFEQAGMFRIVALALDDYGTKYHCMTTEMRDEFKEDMDALVEDGTLQTIPDDMFEQVFNTNIIASYPAPDIPN